MKRALAIAAVLGPLVLFALWPVAALLYRALSGQLSALAVIGAPASIEALWATLRTSLGAATIAFVLGFPLALIIARTDVPGRTALRALWVLPSAIPPFIQGMGWVTLANPKAGLLNKLMGEGTLDIYGEPGTAFVLGIAATPMVLLAAEATLARLDPALEESARVFGSSPLRALAGVSGALALPAALAGATLAFLFSASAFGVPYLLGVTANPPVHTLTTRIYIEWLKGPVGLARAAALSLTLLLMAAAVLVISERLGKRARVALGAGKGVARRQLQLGPWRTPLAIWAWSSAALLVVLPLAAVALTSVMPTFGRLDGLTFAHWGAVLGHKDTLAASTRSVWMALLAGALVAGLGLVFALAQRRLGPAGRTAAVLAAWPYAVPGTVLALGLIVAFSRDLRFVFFDSVALVLALGGTVWLLVVGWTVKHLAFGVRNAGEGLARVDQSLPESARVFGATQGRAFLDATLPQLKAPLAAAFTLTFLTCVTELTLAVLMVPSGTQTLGTLLFELQSYADPASAAVIACAFVLLVLASLGGLAALRRRAA
jgi:iron(III) transport system permease protein